MPRFARLALAGPGSSTKHARYSQVDSWASVWAGRIRRGLGMRKIVHPLADELGGLVEENKPNSPSEDVERDTSWRWMVAIAVGVGLFAWFTR